MSELKYLKFKKTDGVARITLNRPKFNMMNIEMMDELNGLLDGMSVRVPTPTGSCTDLVATLKKETTKDEVNAAFTEAANGSMKGFLEVTNDPIVSSDIVHQPASSIIDLQATMVIGGNMVKCLSWYDNEWGYSNRCIDLFKQMAG